MQFLAPLFFVALAGLAIPVLLHLTQREKKQIVRFPSLMFVRRIPYQSVRRRKIHNWLLLMVRLAALALIVGAFARPLLSGSDQTIPGTGAREVVVLLDASYSMGYGDHWQRARDAAQAEVRRLGASDRGSVVLFASGAEILLRSTGEAARLASSVATAAPGAGATRYAPALKVAGSILSESSLPRKEVVLISDFQRGGWRGEEGARLPRGATLTTVPIQGVADRPNLSVTGLSLTRSTFSTQERVALTAGISNRSERGFSGGSVTLEVGGITVATRPLNVEPGGSTSVTFEPFTISSRNLKGTIRLPDDALAADNAFNFVVSPTEPVRLVLVDRGGVASGVYLTRALAIGDAPRFETTARDTDSVSDEDLRRHAVVLLHDATVTSGLAKRLARFVEQGGGLFVATGPRATWPQEVDILPVSLGAPVDRTRGDAARIGGLEYAHPIFEPFRAPRSGDFSAVPVYGYRQLTATADAQVLTRFDSGAPAMAERRVGKGRVLVWGSTLDVSWSDLPRKSVFLPFLHRTVRHLAGYAEPRPWLNVGQVLDATVVSTARTQSARAVLTPSGRRVPLEDEGAEVLELTEQGFYELRGVTPQDVTVVASNVDPAEADLTPLDPKEIEAAAVGGPPVAASEGSGETRLTPAAREQRQRLWWFLLITGVMLLGLDTLLSNRLSKT